MHVPEENISKSETDNVVSAKVKYFVFLENSCSRFITVIQMEVF